MPYKLSATLAAHTSDVRAVASPTNDLVLSASRDSTAISWRRASSSTSFSPDTVFRAGTRYVSSVAYIPPSSAAPKGYVVTGGQDTAINVFSLESPKEDPDFSMLGHTQNVCTLDVSPGGNIMSGSWDTTAKVWRDFQLLYDLKGHQQSVWAVVAVDEEQCLTGSADKTIKLWQQHKVMATFTGHQDAVRGLALVPDIGFASCSNDAEIRVWTFGGDLVYTLSGHTSFVYSLSVLPNGDIVSGGEDRSVRVWTDGECSQIITHPAISVWTVSTMPNGDIVSGCSDHKVRIFSASEERWASEAALTEYNDQVASQALPAEQVGDVKKSDLPGPDALKEPGKKAGEVKMIRNGANVEAHQWDATNFKWEKIGDVVDAVGQGRRQLYNGKEYDYVFDVDIQDGVPPLKLPYNVTENPYSAAQRFLESNDLPLTYLDEVVHFIEKNTAGVKLGTGGDEFVDPFTGASRYRSTGDSGQSQGSQPPTQYMDPFTGASRYSGASQAPPTTPPASIVLPASKWIPFKQIKDVAAIQRKIFELNGTLRHEISTSALVLYPDEISALDEAFAYLSHVTATPPEQPPNTLAPSHVEEILQIVDRWPPSQRYPLIDLSRLIIGYCPDLMRTPGLCGTFFRSLFRASEWESWDSQLSKTQQTNILLLLKALANVFQDGYAPEMSWIGEVLTYLAQATYQSLGKTQRAAYATVLFNLSCVSLKTPLEPGLQNGHLDLLLRVVKNEENDAESAYRALVGLGNVIHATRSAIPSLSNGQVSEVKESIRQSASKFSGEARIQNVVREILTLL